MPPKTRLTRYDPLVANDPVSAFSVSHNVFARPPSLDKTQLAKALEMFQHYSKTTDRDGEGQDVFMTSSGGHKRAAAYIDAEFARRKLDVVTLELFPKQETLQLRRDFALRAKGERKRKISSFSALSKVYGNETMYFASNYVDMQERENKYVHSGGFETSRNPFLPIGLVDPNTLGPILKQATKQKIFDIYGDGSGNDFAADNPPERVTPDVPSDADAPLCHFERSEEVYLNVLHTTWAATVIDFSPGGGYLALACVRLRIPIVLVVKNSVHKEVLHDFIVCEVKRAMENAGDSRYFRTPADLGVDVLDVDQIDKSNPTGIEEPKKKARKKQTAKSKAKGGAPADSASAEEGSTD